MLAARYGHKGIVKLLVAHPGIQVNLANSHGQLALTLAVRHGHVGVVKALLARSEIQVNLTDNHGWSALMLAAYGGDDAIVRWLLDAPRINIWTRSVEDGYTPMSIALAHGHVGIAQLLQEFDLQHASSDSLDSNLKKEEVEDTGHLARLEKAVTEGVKGGHDLGDRQGQGQKIEVDSAMGYEKHDDGEMHVVPNWRANRRSPRSRRREDVPSSTSSSSSQLLAAPQTLSEHSLLPFRQPTSLITHAGLTSLITPLPASSGNTSILPTETPIDDHAVTKALGTDADNNESCYQRFGTDAVNGPGENANGGRVEQEPPGLRRGAKRSKSEEDGPGGPIDDMAAHASKRRRGATDAEGS
ncbi:ankyrin repeat-containing domain protein [Coprinopsis sp. MPI-PUGE-AT-0042]|nr:ankyrin repeat-containing domain protein [Coprinopsis sp. MPI-PUGE-AT-0042]